MSALSSRLPSLAFWLLGIVWGSNFIYMKMAAGLISPAQIVFFRVLFGFLPVCAYAWFTGAIKREHARHWFHFLVMSLLATTVYYYGFAKGTSLLLSGVAGALSGAIPLFSYVVAFAFLKEEKTTFFKSLGVLVGFAGVVLIARPGGADLAATNMEGVFYMVAGSLSVGASFVYAKKYVTPLKIPAAALTTYQLGLGLLLLAVFTDLTGMNAIWSDLHASVGLVIGLGFLGTGLAYIIYYYIIARLGAVAASSVTYVPPIVALFIGSVLVGEPIALADYGATLLIFAGVFLLKKS